MGPVQSLIFRTGFFTRRLVLDLYSFLYNLPSLLPNMFSLCNYCVLQIVIALFLDYALQVTLLILHILVGAVLLLLSLVLYVGRFIVDRISGNYGKLKKTGIHLEDEKKLEEGVGGETENPLVEKVRDESGYMTAEETEKATGVLH